LRNTILFYVLQESKQAT